jgi:hypothetical protein
MFSRLLITSVAVIGLLAGVQKGSADQIVYACKNNTVCQGTEQNQTRNSVL